MSIYLYAVCAAHDTVTPPGSSGGKNDYLQIAIDSHDHMVMNRASFTPNTIRNDAKALESWTRKGRGKSYCFTIRCRSRRSGPRFRDITTGLTEIRADDACCAQARLAVGAVSAARGRLQEYAMRTESQIKMDVEAQLRWNPDIDATYIGVAVKDGVVTLTGFVPNSNQKVQAERDSKRVDGVLGLANDIAVRVPDVDHRPDAEIARDVVAKLLADLPFSSENVKVTVRRRRVILEGRLEWHYQRERAELAARRVKGIKNCTDSFKLEPHVAINAIEERVEDALAALVAKRGAEAVDPSREALARGTVRSWAQRDDDAGRADAASSSAT